MKTWTNPTVEELEVKMTAGGDDPSICEYDQNFCWDDTSVHFCMEYLLTGECPHGNHAS